MRVIVTRPASQARQWVDRLRANGIDAVALPLIEIAAPADPGAVQQAWRGLAVRQLAMFVSPNAVEHFFALRPADLAGWPPGVLAASPGPGTTRALLAAGVPAGAIAEPPADAPQFDSESLWQRLREHEWAGASALFVRGEGGREWLAETLIAHGAQVDFVAAYRRRAPCWAAGEQAVLATALVAPAAHRWLFSSSEAIDHLGALQPGADWSRSVAIASHPRIAQRARDAGFGRVIDCRPALAAVVACIQSAAS